MPRGAQVGSGPRASRAETEPRGAGNKASIRQAPATAHRNDVRTSASHGDGDEHQEIAASPAPGLEAPAAPMAIRTAGALPRKPAGDSVPAAKGAGAGAVKNAGLTSEQLLELHYFMKLNRRVEERLVNLYRQGKVVGGLYRSLGQEAVSVGAAYALGPGDIMAPLIRDLGAILVRGYAPRDCFAQYLARSTSPTLGRDGVIHMGDIGGRGIVGGMGMLGSLVSVLAGCGLALKMLGHDRVCLTFIGDGGASTGAFHEGLNFAALRKLPLIVVIENNGYAYSTPVSKQTNEPDFSKRGAAFGFPGESVDGNDVLAVYEATRRAIERARAGHGPSVIEARTFRMKGHAEHDDASYVPKASFDEWGKQDPIERFEGWLLSERIACPDVLGRIVEQIETTLDADVRWAEDSAAPDAQSALAGVYAHDTPFAPAPYRRPSREEP